MAQATSIEWTDASWNFIRGCSRVSAGCENCYAESIARRFSKPGMPYDGTISERGKWNGTITFDEKILLEPLKWKKPRRVFVNSMSDLFHENVKDEWLDKAFAVMALTPHITYQILTKRPERMREYFDDTFKGSTAFQRGYRQGEWVWNNCGGEQAIDQLITARQKWPLPNVWLGVSVEDQKTADERIPLLLDTPAAVRFVSYEPALGPVDCMRYLDEEMLCFCGDVACDHTHLDQIIIGGESGTGARPFDVAWARSVIEQCKAAGVAVFVKQLGAVPIYEGVGQPVGDPFPQGLSYLQLKDRKGGSMEEWPEDLRVREFPNV